MIYTIGYGNRSPEAFIDLLKRYKIACLFDVRSCPFSQHQPWFSRDRLSELLRQHDIQYVWMGHLLGDKPTEMGFYTRGRLDYMKYRASSEFKQGLLQLQSAWNAQVRFALMSQTLRPQVCHRAKLIAEALMERGIDVAHVDEAGCLVKHRHMLPNLAAFQAGANSYCAARPN
jgi:uncharacterized protein (DUF488 family)